MPSYTIKGIGHDGRLKYKTAYEALDFDRLVYVWFWWHDEPQDYQEMIDRQNQSMKSIMKGQWYEQTESI